MNKSKVLIILIVGVLASWVFTIFPGHYLQAKLSTWPFLENLKILTPEAPIVITNKETIRVSDSGDAIQAVKDTKSKLSLIVSNNNGTQVINGSAVNLTSDGTFVTGTQTFSDKSNPTYYVLLNDGSLAKITGKVSDPATGLTFFTADLKNVPVVSFGQPSEIEVGEKLVLARTSLTPYMAKFSMSYVIAAQEDVAGQVYQSDFTNKCFTSSQTQDLLVGQSVFNTAGGLIAIWNGTQLICSDALKQGQSLYFQNKQNIARPSFGFEYTQLSQSMGKVLNLPQGLLVKNVDTASAAQKAGLLVGDVITQIDGQDLSPLSVNPDDLLQSYKTGDMVNFSVSRAGKIMNIKLTCALLK